MFKLDMNAIRETANAPRLMANPANAANLANKAANDEPEISQKPPKLARLAKLAISHDLLTARLIAAAMRVCDQYNDTDAKREEMRQDCLDTPHHLRQDLLDYFMGKPAPLH